MNKYALGRNVAAFKSGFGFISGAMQRAAAFVHGLFRHIFQRVGREAGGGMTT
jgi:hypothetical protein